MTHDPYRPPAAPVEDVRERSGAKPRLSWRQVVSIWWSCTWRGAVYAFPVGITFGFVTAFIRTLSPNVSPRPLPTVLLMYPLLIAASILGMKHGLERHLPTLRKG